MYSIQSYWSSIFILPKKVIKAIEQRFKMFLWKGVEENKGNIKVAWDQLCFPKREGGLKKIEDCNKEAVMKHIWSLFAQAESSFDAKVDNLLRNGGWYWPPARSEDLVTIQSQLCLVHIKVSDQLTGLLQLVVNLCVLLPGIRSEAEVQKWIGGNYYGFLKPSLNIASLLLKIG
ncbi:hypothetical protein SO802_025447 [Lithocarpus litseifolius]|uniref:Uncharacterized protein n=1 Tax=Lithocarpus litseifolius TaxID=425828 RepID=A0AAW2BX99_9ROSI